MPGGYKRGSIPLICTLNIITIVIYSDNYIIPTKCPPLATFELVHHEKRKKKHGDIIPIKVKQEHFMKVIIQCKRDEGMYVEDFNGYT